MNSVSMPHWIRSTQVLVAAVSLALAGSATAAPTISGTELDIAGLKFGAAYELGAAAAKSQPNTRALSLAAADVDSDGYPDLFSGYATEKGGLLTIHRGNPEAWAPTLAMSHALIRAGQYPPGFLAEAQSLTLPAAPELMVTGDFDHDGHADLVFAQRGESAVYLLRGNAAGLGAVQKLTQPGAVDALAAGHIDRPDGFADLAIALSTKRGASLQLYTAGIDAPARAQALPAAASELHVGQVDSSPMGDVVALAAGKVLILHGVDRAATGDTLETLDFGFAVQTLALGTFIWDRAGATELALLKDDGTIHIASRGVLETTPFTIEEISARRRAQHALTEVVVKAWQPGIDADWRIAESMPAQMSKASTGASPRLLAARLSNQPADDLLAVDSLGRAINITTFDGIKRSSAQLPATLPPVAVMSLQTSAFPRPGLITLGAGAAAITLIPAAPTATFTVTKTADTNDGVCNADCSLREAIDAANVNGLGADTVSIPAGTYTLTITNAGGVDENVNDTGDLDVIGVTALIGAGAASTIIQAGTTNANGIDKVLAFSPGCFSGISSSLSGVTVRFGRNTQPETDPFFSFTGGGIDVCNTGAGGFTMTNVTVTENNVTNGYGGGINIDTLAPANGTFSISGSTISNNRTSSAASILKNGGGINLLGDSHTVSISNSTISGNTSNALGGGINVNHNIGGAITISGSTISNNTAASRGGGVSNLNLGTATLTINNDSVISGNVSQGTAAGTESRGGGVFIGSSASATTIRETTITGNQASTGAFQGGGGIAALTGTITAQFNRLSGNIAGAAGGSGFHNAGATVTGTRNWWGCNAGPGSAPCDRSANTSGTLTTTPHLVLRHVASPSSIVIGQSTTTTADFLTDSASGPVAVADLDALIGTSHIINNPVRGTLSGVQASIQANGTATATFTATTVGAGSADSVVDAHTQTAPITIGQASTTTTITAHTPDPSLINTAVTVNYSVAVNAPGAGTPTGNVTVSDGVNNCVGSVAAGTCNLTLTTGGPRTLTATYAGDTSFSTSSDTEPHTVSVCPSVVTNGNDAGAGSLRDVIANACEPSTITFQAGVTTVTLTSAEILVNKNVTIDGGTGVTVARSSAGGTPNFRIFNIQTGRTVSMNNLRVQNGNHPAQAGGIENNGTLNLNNMEITGNRSPQGGGIQNNNVLVLNNSTISGNTATLFGGGLTIFGPTTTLTNCTITGNQADSDSGGMNASGTVSITNCTIARNTTVLSAGLGAGIVVNAANLTLRNSIVAANTSGNLSEANFNGTVQAASAFNVVGAGPAGGLTNGVNNNQVGVTPTALSLGALGNYGGATPTLPLLPGSPAINAGTNVSAPATDQRGIARPAAVDVGAFESRGFNLSIAGGSGQTAVISTPFATALSVNVAPVAVGEPVQGGTVSFTPPGAGASASLTTSPASINAGGVASVTAVANATAGGYTVSANSAGNTGSALSFALTNRLLSADLSITKTNGTTTSTPGGSTTYTITASNAGPDPVTGATVADTFPASLTCNWTCVGAGGGTCTASGSGNINSLVNLPSGGSVTFTASCAISASATGTLANTATVSSSISDPTPANNNAIDSDTLTPAANLGITKTDGVASVFAGGNTTYTITTSNAGPSNAPGATVSDTFPAVLTCTWTCVGAGGGTCTAAGAGNINDTVNLPAGGSVTHTASCSISGAASGSLINTATVTAPGGVTDGDVGNNSATDTNTISALPSLSVNDVSVAEGNAGTGILTFTVTRTGPAAGAVGFDFATSDGTATTANADYVSASGTGSIASGGATGTTTISVTINGDAIFENSENFNVTLSAPTGAVIADATGIGTITNDDTAPTLAIDDVVIVEGNAGTQNLVFTVTRTGLTALPASFTAVTANGTASAPSDYLAALAGTTSIAAGGATGTTTLTATINGDFVVEANETFFVNLSAPANATLSDGQGLGTITNDDTAGIVLVQSMGSTDVTEGGATDSYTLVLTSQPTANVSIALNPDGQVTAATSPVVFTSANWATPQVVTVTAVDDVIVEGPHTGTIIHAVTSGDATYNTFPVANVVANITDNDLPTLAINDVSIAEGNSGTQILTFTVTRTGTTASAVGFSFATADGTATTADSDYLVASGTGAIPSGGASGTTTVSLTINGDATFENTESFFVNLTAPTNATIADAQGVGTITNDDAAPTLAINDVSIVEGNTGTQNLVFTVTRTGLTALPASFTAATADSIATAPSDYLAALVGSTTIAAGGATGTTTLSATINGDFIVEPNETFFVNLSAPANATISDNQGLGTITNDDTAGISVVQSGGTTDVTEGGATDTYTLVLTSQPTADVSIALNGGTQVTLSPTPLVFTSGNWNLPQTVTVTAVDDPVIEGNHSGAVTSAVTSVNGIYNGFVVAPVSVAITDNDTPGVALVESGGNTLVTEGGATDTYTMVLTSQPSANVTVTPNGGAQLNNPPAVVFTNANWNLPQTVTVMATDDNVVEGTHSGSISHTVTSADGNYEGLVVGQVSGSITDNDSAVVAFDPIGVSQSEATSPMAFTVTLSNPVASGVTVTVNSAPGTATAADFTPIVAGTVTFPANSTASQTVNVVINNDVLDEDDETFTLTLSAPIATGTVTLGTAVATGTIVDNDLPPVISITSPSQLEGNAGNTPMNFVVSLSAISGRDVTFTRATADGTATVANNDYQPLAAASATIPAGQMSITIPVQIVGNTLFEGNETFSLNLTGVVNATPTSLSGTGTIEDDDQQPTTTTITSDLPDPSVVGQPYPVNVTVTAVSTSPLGTVTISDGTDSCGPVAVTTGTAPNSSASCNLTSTTAGAKTLTASYTAASTAFADSVGTTAHQVNAAGTSISVVGPPRSRINQPITFTFALSVNAPGAGSPAGTVTLSSGAANCNVTVPTATPSCALTFDTLGPRTVSAAFVPGNGNFLGSSSSGAGDAQTLVFALSDIAVTKSNGAGTYVPGELIVYTVTVRNLGPDAATGIRVRDQVPVGLLDVVWSCDASGGVVCPQEGGSGDLDATTGAFPVGGLLNYTFYGNAGSGPAPLVNTALVELPADTTIEDPLPGNNSASDTDLLEFLFRNGFEDPIVNSQAGSYLLPTQALRGVLDDVARVVYELDDANGPALRVYARLFDGEVQFALAVRGSNGALRLGAWQSFEAEPQLNWTATAVADGWLLEVVELR